jgi:hypothetical protein
MGHPAERVGQDDCRLQPLAEGGNKQQTAYGKQDELRFHGTSEHNDDSRQDAGVKSL